MEITWYGGSCFRLRDKNTNVTALADPYMPDPRFQNLQVKADLITVSRLDLELRNIVPNVRTPPYIIEGPGEYEIRGCFVRALWNVANDDLVRVAEGDGPRGLVFSFVMDGVSICHLGQLGMPLEAPVVEAISPVDILIMPPGGIGKLTDTEAAKILSDVSPKVVILMDYASNGSWGGDANQISSFLEEAGLDRREPVPSLSLTTTSLPGDKTELVFLESRTKEKRPTGARSLP